MNDACLGPGVGIVTIDNGFFGLPDELAVIDDALRVHIGTRNRRSQSQKSRKRNGS